MADERIAKLLMALTTKLAVADLIAVTGKYLVTNTKFILESWAIAL